MRMASNMTPLVAIVSHALQLVQVPGAVGHRCLALAREMLDAVAEVVLEVPFPVMSAPGLRDAVIVAADVHQRVFFRGAACALVMAPHCRRQRAPLEARFRTVSVSSSFSLLKIGSESKLMIPASPAEVITP